MLAAAREMLADVGEHLPTRVPVRERGVPINVPNEAV
jgi:hypothetical protein